MVDEHRMVPLDEIILDPDNPRIKLFLAAHEEQGQDITTDMIRLALGAHSDAVFEDDEANENATLTKQSYERLKRSIQATKGIIQPVILRPDPDNPEKFLCIEGNTRLVIYGDLKAQDDKTSHSGKWDKILSIIRTRMKDNDVHRIRLQAHVVGVREWNPYSKARYLYELREKEDMSIDEIINYCGGDRTEVKQSIAAYEDMENYYRPEVGGDANFDPQKFSAFMVLQRASVKDAIYKAGYNEKDFAKWVIDRKIDPLSTARSLPRILAENRAKQVFLREGARKARQVLETPGLKTQLQAASLEQLITATLTKMRQLDYEESDNLKSDKQSQQYQDLLELADEIIDIIGRDALTPE